MEISYSSDVTSIISEQLSGFFVGWKNKPDEATLKRLLERSDEVIVATDSTKKVIGFVTAITDGVLSAYIPFLEVLPEFQKQGIGAELVKRMLARLEQYYMVDIMCDKDLQPFYEKFGLQPSTGMVKRNYPNQSGRNA